MAYLKSYFDNGLFNLADELDRVLVQSYPANRTANPVAGQWTPKVDLSEDQTNYYVAFEIPGMPKDAVKIQVENGLLKVSGEKKAPEMQEGLTYHRSERLYGNFERTFKLGDRINVEKINAAFQDGILTITLPKAEKAMPREIKIS